jgi:uncharacterized protein (TIGR02996 family)
MPTEGDLLLAGVLEEPGEDAPRLVYADWLEENGEPYRAMFIRAQIEWAGVADFPGVTREQRDSEHARELKRRAFDLWLHHAERSWYGSAYLLGYWNGSEAYDWFHRGFIDQPVCPLRLWKEYGPTIVRESPVARVVLTDRRPASTPLEYTVTDLRQYLPFWYEEDVSESPSSPPTHWLPSWVFGFLTGGELMRSRRRCYPTPEDPWTDLSRACIAWAKSPTPAPDPR